MKQRKASNWAKDGSTEKENTKAEKNSMGHSRPLFIYFCLFYAISSNIFTKILPMTGSEPRTSGIGSDRSANWATTTALKQTLFKL